MIRYSLGLAGSESPLPSGIICSPVRATLVIPIVSPAVGETLLVAALF